MASVYGCVKATECFWNICKGYLSKHIFMGNASNQFDRFRSGASNLPRSWEQFPSPQLHNERRRREGRGVEGAKGCGCAREFLPPVTVRGSGRALRAPPAVSTAEPELSRKRFTRFEALDDLWWQCFAAVGGSINTVNLGHYKA
jgi:hypothetical protein